MPDELGRTLEQVPVPDMSARRDAAVRLAAARSRRSERIRKARSAVAAAVILAGVGLTPAGQAVAGDLGRLVGIGEPSSFDQSANQRQPASGPGVVVASGTVPGTDEPYELVGYRSEEYDGSPEAGGPFSCLNLDLPELEQASEVESNDVCISAPRQEPVETTSYTDNHSLFGPAARFTVDGYVDPAVDRVEVTYVNSAGERVQAPVVLGVLGPELAEAADAPYQWGRFFAFLPPGDEGSSNPGPFAEVPAFVETVEVAAFSEGEQVADEAWGQEFVERLGSAPG